jgi:hypothetical protein
MAATMEEGEEAIGGSRSRRRRMGVLYYNMQ